MLTCSQAVSARSIPRRSIQRRLSHSGTEYRTESACPCMRHGSEGQGGLGSRISVRKTPFTSPLQSRFNFRVRALARFTDSLPQQKEECDPEREADRPQVLSSICTTTGRRGSGLSSTGSKSPIDRALTAQYAVANFHRQARSRAVECGFAVRARSIRSSRPSSECCDSTSTERAIARDGEGEFGLIRRTGCSC